MTPQDIKVGTRYASKDWPGLVWIGAGKREPFTYGSTSEYTEKFLVLIESDTPFCVGNIYKTPEDEWGASQEDWDLFYPIS